MSYFDVFWFVGEPSNRFLEGCEREIMAETKENARQVAISKVISRLVSDKNLRVSGPVRVIKIKAVQV